MRLLITGASGFLGAHLVAAAARAGAEVIALAHRAPQPAPLPPGVAAVQLDAEDPAPWRELLERLAPSAIVNVAALSRAADCDARPSDATLVNVALAEWLARWSAARGARLVHVSTDLVFGAREAPRGGFGESDEPGPVSLYGRTKLAGERAVLAADPRALVARLPLLVGPSLGRGLGASDSVVAARARGERPRLFTDEFRTPLDVRSAAEALVELAGRDERDILHVAGPERISRHELGLRALRQTGLRADEARAAVIPTERGALAAQRPADVSLDSSRARGLLRTVLVGLESGAI